MPYYATKFEFRLASGTKQSVVEAHCTIEPTEFPLLGALVWTVQGGFVAESSYDPTKRVASARIVTWDRQVLVSVLNRGCEIGSASLEMQALQTSGESGSLLDDDPCVGVSEYTNMTDASKGVPDFYEEYFGVFGATGETLTAIASAQYIGPTECEWQMSLAFT